MATKRIVFIPIKHGDEVEIGDLGIFGVSEFWLGEWWGDRQS